MAKLELDGVLVRHDVRPAESLLERAPLRFALTIFGVTLGWMIIASIFEEPTLVLVGTPIVILASILSPWWLTVRADITGSRRIMLDEQGIRIGGILVPWDEVTVNREGDHETVTSFWELGSETITVTFEHDDTHISAFLGVRYRARHPFVSTERLYTTMSEPDLLRLEAIIAEHAPIMSCDPDRT